MTMAMWAQDRLYIAVLHGGAPTDEEWDRWVGLGVQRNGRDQRVLVEARGGGPTPKQRRAILGANKADARIAIITESTFVRGIVTAFSWFGIALSTANRAPRASGPRGIAQLLRDEVGECAHAAQDVAPGWEDEVQ
jgi:hypothetical protein